MSAKELEKLIGRSTEENEEGGSGAEFRDGGRCCVIR